MKKLVIALAIISMGVLSAQGIWNRDVAQLQQDLSQAAETDINTRVTLTGAIALLQTPPQNINDVAAVFATVVNSVCDDQWTEASKTDLVHTKVKQYLLAKKLWLVEAWQYCKANPSDYDVYYLLNKTPAQLGETPDSYYEAVYQTLVAGIKNPAQAGKLIKHFCNYLPKSSLPRPERFAKLQMLNDIYTAKLIEDKAAWGDVIAQIRTVMELYK